MISGFRYHLLTLFNKWRKLSHELTKNVFETHPNVVLLHEQRMPKYLKFYCGFSLITNQTKMTESEITLEVEALKSRIFDHVLLVTGEATVKYHTISKCN
jgi:hypothetical protein